MRNFAQLSPTFWTRGLGRRLRGNPEAVALVVYLSTSPSANMIGLYYLPLVTICHDLGMPELQVRALLNVPAVAQAVAYDFEEELVWVVEHVVEQLGAALKPTDNKVAGVERELAEAGSHRFVDEFRARYGGSHCSRSKIKTEDDESPSEAPSKGGGASQKPPYQSQSPSPSQDRSHDPRERADVKQAVATFERVTRAPRPLGRLADDEGLRVLVGMLDAVPVESACRAIESLLKSDYWTNGAATPGLGSLTLEAITRELTKLEQADARQRSRVPRKAPPQQIGALVVMPDELREAVARG